MPGLGPWELVIILLIVVVIFGAGRLSEIGGALGKSVREFRSATGDEKDKAAKEQAALNAQTVTTPSATVTTVTPVATSTPPAAAAENTCPSCATVNPAGQVFCGQCGTRLTRAA
jgi:sec-independent protein translocase protein TatA